MEDLNLYDDLDEFQEQHEKKSKELQEAEEKYQQSLKTIEELREENKALKKNIQRIEVGFQSLLDTARNEIKRKEKEIERLRKENDDICFRRKVPTKSINPKEDPNFAKNSSVNNPFKHNQQKLETSSRVTATNSTKVCNKVEEKTEIYEGNRVNNEERNNSNDYKRHQSTRKDYDDKYHSSHKTYTTRQQKEADFQPSRARHRENYTDITNKRNYSRNNSHDRGESCRKVSHRSRSRERDKLSGKYKNRSQDQQRARVYSKSSSKSPSNRRKIDEHSTRNRSKDVKVCSSIKMENSKKKVDMDLGEENSKNKNLTTENCQQKTMEKSTNEKQYAEKFNASIQTKNQNEENKQCTTFTSKDDFQNKSDYAFNKNSENEIHLAITSLEATKFCTPRKMAVFNEIFGKSPKEINPTATNSANSKIFLNNAKAKDCEIEVISSATTSPADYTDVDSCMSTPSNKTINIISSSSNTSITSTTSKKIDVANKLRDEIDECFIQNPAHNNETIACVDLTKIAEEDMGNELDFMQIPGLDLIPKKTETKAKDDVNTLVSIRENLESNDKVISKKGKSPIALDFLGFDDNRTSEASDFSNKNLSEIAAIENCDTVNKKQTNVTTNDSATNDEMNNICGINVSKNKLLQGANKKTANTMLSPKENIKMFEESIGENILLKKLEKPFSKITSNGSGLSEKTDEKCDSVSGNLINEVIIVETIKPGGIVSLKNPYNIEDGHEIELSNTHGTATSVESVISDKVEVIESNTKEENQKHSNEYKENEIQSKSSEENLVLKTNLDGGSSGLKIDKLHCSLLEREFSPQLTKELDKIEKSIAVIPNEKNYVTMMDEELQSNLGKEETFEPKTFAQGDSLEEKSLNEEKLPKPVDTAVNAPVKVLETTNLPCITKKNTSSKISQKSVESEQISRGSSTITKKLLKEELTASLQMIKLPAQKLEQIENGSRISTSENSGKESINEQNLYENMDSIETAGWNLLSSTDQEDRKKSDENIQPVEVNAAEEEKLTKEKSVHENSPAIDVQMKKKNLYSFKVQEVSSDLYENPNKDVDSVKVCSTEEGKLLAKEEVDVNVQNVSSIELEDSSYLTEKLNKDDHSLKESSFKEPEIVKLKNPHPKIEGTRKENMSNSAHPNILCDLLENSINEEKLTENVDAAEVLREEKINIFEERGISSIIQHENSEQQMHEEYHTKVYQEEKSTEKLSSQVIVTQNKNNETSSTIEPETATEALSKNEHTIQVSCSTEASSLDKKAVIESVLQSKVSTTVQEKSCEKSHLTMLNSSEENSFDEEKLDAFPETFATSNQTKAVQKGDENLVTKLATHGMTKTVQNEVQITSKMIHGYEEVAKKVVDSITTGSKSTKRLSEKLIADLNSKEKINPIFAEKADSHIENSSADLCNDTPNSETCINETVSSISTKSSFLDSFASEANEVTTCSNNEDNGLRSILIEDSEHETLAPEGKLGDVTVVKCDEETGINNSQENKTAKPFQTDLTNACSDTTKRNASKSITAIDYGDFNSEVKICADKNQTFLPKSPDSKENCQTKPEEDSCDTNRELCLATATVGNSDSKDSSSIKASKVKIFSVNKESDTDLHTIQDSSINVKTPVKNYSLASALKSIQETTLAINSVEVGSKLKENLVENKMETKKSIQPIKGSEKNFENQVDACPKLPILSSDHENSPSSSLLCLTDFKNKDDALDDVANKQTITSIKSYTKTDSESQFDDKMKDHNDTISKSIQAKQDLISLQRSCLELPEENLNLKEMKEIGQKPMEIIEENNSSSDNILDKIKSRKAKFDVEEHSMRKITSIEERAKSHEIKDRISENYQVGIFSKSFESTQQNSCIQKDHYEMFISEKMPDAVKLKKVMENHNEDLKKTNNASNFGIPKKAIESESSCETLQSKQLSTVSPQILDVENSKIACENSSCDRLCLQEEIKNAMVPSSYVQSKDVSGKEKIENIFSQKPIYTLKQEDNSKETVSLQGLEPPVEGKLCGENLRNKQSDFKISKASAICEQEKTFEDNTEAIKMKDITPALFASDTDHTNVRQQVEGMHINNDQCFSETKQVIFLKKVITKEINIEGEIVEVVKDILDVNEIQTISPNAEMSKQSNEHLNKMQCCLEDSLKPHNFNFVSFENKAEISEIGLNYNSHLDKQIITAERINQPQESASLEPEMKTFIVLQNSFMPTMTTNLTENYIVLPSISTTLPTPSNFSGLFSKKPSCTVTSEDELNKSRKKFLQLSAKPKEYVLPAASVLCNVDNLENATKINKKLHWELMSNEKDVPEVEDDADIDNTDDEEIKIKQEPLETAPDSPKQHSLQKIIDPCLLKTSPSSETDTQTEDESVLNDSRQQQGKYEKLRQSEVHRVKQKIHKKVKTKLKSIVTPNVSAVADVGRLTLEPVSITLDKRSVGRPRKEDTKTQTVITPPQPKRRGRKPKNFAESTMQKQKLSKCIVLDKHNDNQLELQEDIQNLKSIASLGVQSQYVCAEMPHHQVGFDESLKSNNSVETSAKPLDGSCRNVPEFVKSIESSVKKMEIGNDGPCSSKDSFERIKSFETQILDSGNEGDNNTSLVYKNICTNENDIAGSNTGLAEKEICESTETQDTTNVSAKSSLKRKESQDICQINKSLSDDQDHASVENPESCAVKEPVTNNNTGTATLHSARTSEVPENSTQNCSISKSTKNKCISLQDIDIINVRPPKLHLSSVGIAKTTNEPDDIIHNSSKLETYVDLENVTDSKQTQESTVYENENGNIKHERNNFEEPADNNTIIIRTNVSPKQHDEKSITKPNSTEKTLSEVEQHKTKKSIEKESQIPSDINTLNFDNTKPNKRKLFTPSVYEEHDTRGNSRRKRDLKELQASNEEIVIKTKEVQQVKLLRKSVHFASDVTKSTTPRKSSVNVHRRILDSSSDEDNATLAKKIKLSPTSPKSKPLIQEQIITTVDTKNETSKSSRQRRKSNYNELSNTEEVKISGNRTESKDSLKFHAEPQTAAESSELFASNKIEKNIESELSNFDNASKDKTNLLSEIDNPKNSGQKTKPVTSLKMRRKSMLIETNSSNNNKGVKEKSTHLSEKPDATIVADPNSDLQTQSDCIQLSRKSTANLLSSNNTNTGTFTAAEDKNNSAEPKAVENNFNTRHSQHANSGSDLLTTSTKQNVLSKRRKSTNHRSNLVSNQKSSEMDSSTSKNQHQTIKIIKGQPISHASEIAHEVSELKPDNSFHLEADSDAAVIPTQEKSVQLRRKPTNQRRILDSSSEEEPLIKKQTVISTEVEACAELLAKPKKRKRRVVKVLSTSVNSSRNPSNSSQQSCKQSPAATSPLLNHPIFNTDVSIQSTEFAVTLPMTPNHQDDSKLREIDSKLHELFQSPPHSRNLSGTATPNQTFLPGPLNDSKSNETIDETVDFDRENDRSSLNVSQGNESSVSLNDTTTLHNNSEVKHLRLGSAEYRFEKVSDKVINLFISRKRKRKPKN